MICNLAYSELTRFSATPFVCVQRKLIFFGAWPYWERSHLKKYRTINSNLLCQYLEQNYLWKQG